MKKEFFINNRKKLMEQLEDNSVTVLFQEDAPYKSADYKYSFVQNRNFYYTTGFPRENSIFLASKLKGKVTEFLFIERYDPLKARWIGPRLSVEEARELTGIEEIFYLDEFHEKFQGLPNQDVVELILYLDLERQEYKGRSTKSERFSQEILGLYPYYKVKNCFNYIANLRFIKTEEEIDLIRKAIEITKEGLYNMWAHIKPGMMEYELEAHFNYTLNKKGVKFTAFNTIVGSGHNGTVLHYEDNVCEMKDNTLVLTDLGAQYKLYNGDITRTVPVNGKFTKRQREVYEAVLEAQKAIEGQVKPGVMWNDINEFAKVELAKACKKLGLIKEDSELTKYYFHTFGHPLGLDTHDVGCYDNPLAPGMIYTNEPGLYIPEESIGIRIEDDLLVTEDGCENLSKGIIKEVDDIERFIAEHKKTY